MSDCFINLLQEFYCQIVALRNRLTKNFIRHKRFRWLNSLYYEHDKNQKILLHYNMLTILHKTQQINC